LLLPELIDKDNTARDVWAECVYRSNATEKYFAEQGRCLQSHPQEVEGQAHAVAHHPGQWPKIQGAGCGRAFLRPAKGPMGLFMRTIGIARARTKIGLADIVFNMKRVLRHAAQSAPA
jgi:hypothetical protein